MEVLLYLIFKIIIKINFFFFFFKIIFYFKIKILLHSLQINTLYITSPLIIFKKNIIFEESILKKSFFISFYQISNLKITKSKFIDFLSSIIYFNNNNKQILLTNFNGKYEISNNVFNNISSPDIYGAIYINQIYNSNSSAYFYSNQFILCESRDMNGHGAAICVGISYCSIILCCFQKCMAGMTTSLQILNNNPKVFYLNNTFAFNNPGRNNVFGISCIDISTLITSSNYINFTKNSHPSLTSYYVYLTGLSFCVDSNGTLKYLNLFNNSGGTIIFFKGKKNTHINLEYGNVINNLGGENEQLIFVSAPSTISKFSFLNNNCNIFRVSDITLSLENFHFKIFDCYYDKNLTFENNTYIYSNLNLNTYLITFNLGEFNFCKFEPTKNLFTNENLLIISIFFIFILCIIILFYYINNKNFKNINLNLEKRINIQKDILDDFG